MEQKIVALQQQLESPRADGGGENNTDGVVPLPLAMVAALAVMLASA